MRMSKLNNSGFFRFLIATHLLTFLCFGSLSLAQYPVDQPASDESFKSFFARITHGGSFPGIRLEAPEAFQKKFYSKIYRPFWMGALNKAQKQITDHGGDLWFDFYKTQNIAHWLFPTPDLNSKFSAYFDKTILVSTQCLNKCRNWDILSNTPFSAWTIAEREAFVLCYVNEAQMFEQRKITDFLADQYGKKSEALSDHFLFRLLNAKDFEKALRELGWEGEVYFRGITAPDPKNPNNRIILMNDDLMKAMTPFDSPIMQSLEYVGILTHEISHVFQDLESQDFSINLEIFSAEGALLIEGSAEFFAEQALRKAALSWKDQPQSLNVFVAENAVEIVNRPGNEQQGNLFPYTVGLPFIAALDDLSIDKNKMRLQIYNTIAQKQTLTELLSKF